jgi:hypothetical protein
MQKSLADFQEVVASDNCRSSLDESIGGGTRLT